MADSEKPYWIVFTVDYKVFAYVAVVCLLTAIAAGLVPALLVSRPGHPLKEGSLSRLGARTMHSSGGALILVQIALAFILLAGGGLVTRSFMKLYSMDLGIRTDQLMVLRMRLREERTTRLRLARRSSIAFTLGLPGSPAWTRPR